MRNDFPRPPCIVGATSHEDTAIASEALAAHRAYVVDVIEGLGFCPWAEPARKAGRVQEVVWLAPLDADAFFAHVDAWARDASVEVVLVVLPNGDAARDAHDRRVRALRDHDALRGGELSLTFAMAAFHPDVQPDATSAQRLVPFLRCSPMPSLQLVRRSVLDALRDARDAPRYVDPSTIDVVALASTPARKSLHERIADENLSTARRIGIDALRDKLESIKPPRSRRAR